MADAADKVAVNRLFDRAPYHAAADASVLEVGVAEPDLLVLGPALCVRPSQRLADHDRDESDAPARGMRKTHVKKLVRRVGGIRCRKPESHEWPLDVTKIFGAEMSSHRA